MQAQLLRVLQEGEIRRVGGTEAIKVDVRVVAATNRELEDEVKQSRFREVSTFASTWSPSGCRRCASGRATFRCWSTTSCPSTRRASGAATRATAPAAMALLVRHAWPGNVRELENVIERGLALSKDGVILPSDLPPEVATPRARRWWPPPAHRRRCPSLQELERR